MTPEVPLTTGSFAVTHVVPPSGMSAWSEPDGTKSPAAQLDPGLEVQVVEVRGEWARVMCSNGWGAWVDAQRLSAVRAPAPRLAAPSRGLSVEDVGIPALLGAALVIVGTFLKWWTVGPASVTAWHVPVKFLLAGSAGNGVDVGPFMFVVVLVALPLFIRRPLPSWSMPVIALVPLLAALGALIRGLRESPSLHPGIGILLTIAGGLLIIVQTQGFATFGLKGRSR